MSGIITTSELENRNKQELSALFCKVSQQVAKSEPGSPERRNALASLENINRMLNAPRIQYPKPPGF